MIQNLIILSLVDRDSAQFFQATNCTTVKPREFPGQKSAGGFSCATKRPSSLSVKYGNLRRGYFWEYVVTTLKTNIGWYASYIARHEHGWLLVLLFWTDMGNLAFLHYPNCHHRFQVQQKWSDDCLIRYISRCESIRVYHIHTAIFAGCL